MCQFWQADNEPPTRMKKSGSIRIPSPSVMETENWQVFNQSVRVAGALRHLVGGVSQQDVGWAGETCQVLGIVRVTLVCPNATANRCEDTDGTAERVAGDDSTAEVEDGAGEVTEGTGVDVELTTDGEWPSGADVEEHPTTRKVAATNAAPAKIRV